MWCDLGEWMGVISVVVATVDRVAQLEGCLAALTVAFRQAPDGSELIVVDNGSADASRDLTERFRERADFPVRLLVEPRRGLSRARNTGIAAARGTVIAFTDDDCRVESTWLREIDAEFSDPTLDVLGGRVDLASPNDAKVSVRPFEDPARIESLDAVSRHLIGCNVAARRPVFETAGVFDERLGAGTVAASAEDLDFFYRCLRRGCRLAFSPSVRVRHAHGRRDVRDLAMLNRGYVRGRGAFYAKHMVRGDRVVWQRCYWEVAGLAKASLRQPGVAMGHLRSLLAGGSGYLAGSRILPW